MKTILITLATIATLAAAHAQEQRFPSAYPQQPQGFYQQPQQVIVVPQYPANNLEREWQMRAQQQAIEIQQDRNRILEQAVTQPDPYYPKPVANGKFEILGY